MHTSRMTGSLKMDPLTVEELKADRSVDVLPPVLAIGRHGDLPVRPLAG